MVGLVEMVLLELGSTYFTSGYNSAYIDGVLLISAFVMSAVVLDAALVLGIWALTLPLLRRVGPSTLQIFGLAGLIALVIPLGLDFARKRLYVVLGDMLRVDLLWQVSGASASGSAAMIMAHAPSLGLVAALGVGSVVAVLIGARRLEPRGVMGFKPPDTRSLWLGCLGATALGAMILVLPSAAASRVQYGLRGKQSGTLVARLVQWVTDVDRDGFGVLSQPPDPAPFDGSIHPFAVDLPDNGIDENGLAGDHPGDFEPQRPVREDGLGGDARPDFLLVLLESFRGDILFRELKGRPVTPFMNQLARSGAHSERAYVHSPLTSGSRAQLFGGELVPYPGQTTLIDDFREIGYEIAYFSGQDDSFADGKELLGWDRVDHFYDARQDKERKTSRSTNPIGLQVSWKVVLERAREFLDARGSSRPLFLYVNLVDTHFPYHHHEIDDILGIEPISRHEIRPERVARVWETYLNTAANVDRAIDELVGAWRAHLGREHGILITSDHGQAIYDSGYLGHGQSLGDDQARVPFILWGIGGVWPEPLGLADVRGLLRRNLTSRWTTEVPRARFVPQRDRAIIQYMSKIHHPLLLGLRAFDRTTLYDFKNDQVRILDANQEVVELGEEEADSAFASLIWNWEATRLELEDRERYEPHPDGTRPQ